MSDAATSGSGSPSNNRSRGSHKPRGGFGKYLRARGRGRGRGRPAEFRERLLLEGEGPQDEEDEEEAAERIIKYSRRQLGTNADRYEEPEPELGSDGEPIVEPSAPHTKDEDDGVDHSLDYLNEYTSQSKSDIAASKKGKVQEVQWDNELDEMMREKDSADAARDLKSRFRAKSEKLKTKPAMPSARDRKHETGYVEAPPLPRPENAKPKSQLDEMEDFLDELLG